jgi:hypothetical protein
MDHHTEMDVPNSELLLSYSGVACMRSHGMTLEEIPDQPYLSELLADKERVRVEIIVREIR